MGIECGVDYSLPKLECKPQNDKRFLQFTSNHLYVKSLGNLTSQRQTFMPYIIMITLEDHCDPRVNVTCFKPPNEGLRMIRHISNFSYII